MTDNDQPLPAYDAEASLSVLKAAFRLHKGRGLNVFEEATLSMAHSLAWTENGRSIPTLKQVVDQLAKQAPESAYAHSVYASLRSLIRFKPTDIMRDRALAPKPTGFDPWLLGYTLNGEPYHFDPWLWRRTGSGKSTNLGPLILKLRAQIALEEKRKQFTPEVLEAIDRAVANQGRPDQVTRFHRHLPAGRPPIRVSIFDHKKG